MLGNDTKWKSVDMSGEKEIDKFDLKDQQKSDEKDFEGPILGGRR